MINNSEISDVIVGVFPPGTGMRIYDGPKISHFRMGPNPDGVMVAISVADSIAGIGEVELCAKEALIEYQKNTTESEIATWPVKGPLRIAPG